VVVRGLAGVEFIEEGGGGLTFKRRHFFEFMDQIARRDVRTLRFGRRDRLTRFGFAWFGHVAKTHGCEILALNQERLSPEQDMAPNRVSIVHCCSSRRYGLRTYRKTLNDVLKQDARHAPDAQNRSLPNA
jgi:predicted site-specific integrase-resolvase